MTGTDTLQDREVEPELDVTPPNVVHLTATQLADAVALVKPHLGSDDTLPQLTSYRLDVRDGSLWVSATDRYSAAAARIEPAVNRSTDLKQSFHGDFHATLPGDLAHRAISIFKPNRREPLLDPQLAIRVTEIPTFRGSTSQTVIEQRLLPDGYEATKLVGQAHSTALDILDLLHGLLESVRDAKERIDHSAFNGRLLNRFAGVGKVVGEYAPLILRQERGNRPLVVTCSDRFVGALMPVRLADDPGLDIDAWIKRLTARAPKAAKKATR